MTRMTVTMGWMISLVVGCSAPAPEPQFGATARFVPAETGLPAPLDLPWPHDVYRSDADGTIADGLIRWPSSVVGGTGKAWEAYGALDGFGLNAGILFRIDGELDVEPASLPATGAASLEQGSSVALVEVASGKRLPCTAGFSKSTRVLVVLPERTLGQGQRYAVGLTWGVKVSGDKALGPADAFKAIRDSTGTARATSAGKLTGEAVDALAKAGLERSRLVAATVFTTQTAPRRVKATRDALVAGEYGPAPTFLTAGLTLPLGLYRFGADAHPGWTATLDALLGLGAKALDGTDLPGFPGASEPTTTGFGHDAMGAVISGAFKAPEFRRAWKQTTARDDGTIEFAASGKAVARSEALIPVTFVLPKAPPPDAGYPVVIFQHGGGGDRAMAGVMANELARRGIATAALDAPWHGLRGASPADTGAAGGRGTYNGPDGFADASGAPAVLEMLGRMTNWGATRDNFTQLALDLAQLRRLIGNNVDLGVAAEQYGGVAPKLDSTRVGYGGMSMGGMVGTVLAGIEPGSSIGPFFLDVAGARLVGLAFADAPDFALQAPLLAASASPPPGFTADRFQPWLSLAQGLTDGADPSAFAATAGAESQGHDLFLMGAQFDTAVPRSASDLLMRELGVAQLTPAVRAVDGLSQVASPLRATATSRARAYFEAAPGCHGHLGWRSEQVAFKPPWPVPGVSGDARFVALPKKFQLREAVVGAQRAMANYFATAFAGAAELRVTGADLPGLAPVADFDDDGWCDADEQSAGADPYDPASKPSAGAPGCPRPLGW